MRARSSGHTCLVNGPRRAALGSRTGEHGFAHIAVLVVAVVVAFVLVAVLDTPSTTSSPASVSADGARTRKIELAAVVHAVVPAIVDVEATLASGRGRVAATGLILTPSGTVLTNNHVIADASSITAQVGGTGRRYDASVVGYDVADDVAVIQLDGAHGLPTIDAGDGTSARVGDAVAAIGNAYGLGGMPHPEAGTITAFGQRVTASDATGRNGVESLSDMIEVAAPVRPGDSGGALVDAHGRVIGMTTATTAANADPERGGTEPGAGFAIPIGRALAIAHRIRTGAGSTVVHIGPRAVLGVEIKSATSTTRPGAVVGLVRNTSSARTAGVHAGDVIVSVDRTQIAALADLEAALSPHRPGDDVRLGWVDPAGHFRTGVVRLGNGPPL